MAFASEIKGYGKSGDKSTTWGIFTNGVSDTGGDINTGLVICESLSIEFTGSAAVADAPAINESFPCSGSAVTIVTTANANGIWRAVGY
jgi:hypothetical protein